MQLHQLHWLKVESTVTHLRSLQYGLKIGRQPLFAYQDQFDVMLF